MIGPLRHLLPRRPCIGLALDATHVRAVAVRGARVLWATEAERGTLDSLAMAVEDLLSRGPLPRWPRPRVIASIGPARVQVRRLTGLPPLEDTHAVEALVRENVSRFFLRNGVPLVTSRTSRSGDGAVWAAAFEQPIVDELDRACRARRLRLDAVIPSSIALSHVTKNGIVRRCDGEIVEVATFENGALTRIGRLRVPDAARPDETRLPPDTGDGSALPPELSTLGNDADRFLESFGAARCEAVAPLSYRPRAPTSGHPEVPRWRLVLSAASLLIAATTAIVAEPLHATLVARRAGENLARLGSARIEAARAELELLRVSGALAEAALFEQRNRRVLPLLGLFADSLPDGTALVTLRADSVGGAAVILSAQLAAAMTILDRQRVLAGVEIRGPVTRERIDGREVERATLHFRLPRDSGAHAAPPAEGSP